MMGIIFVTMQQLGVLFIGLGLYLKYPDHGWPCGLVAGFLIGVLPKINELCGNPFKDLR